MNDITIRRATEIWSAPIPRRIACLECGRKFEVLSGHLSRKHKIAPAQYRENHGFAPNYPLQVKEPPAPQSAGHRIVEYYKDFRLGLPGGLTCCFEFPLPEFSLAALETTNRQDFKLISEVRDFCDWADINVWVSIREFQTSVILETGKGTQFRLWVFQFSKNVHMATCKMRFSELW